MIATLTKVVTFPKASKKIPSGRTYLIHFITFIKAFTVSKIYYQKFIIKFVKHKEIHTISLIVNLIKEKFA